MWKSSPIRRNAVGLFFSSVPIDFDERCCRMIFIVAELYRNTDMNPQPSPSVGILFSIIALLIIAYNAIKMHNSLKLSGETINYDLVNIGFMKNDPCLVQNFIVPISNNALYQDCVDALIGIGYKKKQAHKKAQSVFGTNSPSSVVEFIQIAMKNQK